MSDSTHACGGSLGRKISKRYEAFAGAASRPTMSDLPAPECPFCRLPAERVLDSNRHALAVADAFPVSPGHTLIILRRHVASFFEMSADEVAAVYQLLCHMKLQLAGMFHPDGYNIGVNDGE